MTPPDPSSDEDDDDDGPPADLVPSLGDLVAAEGLDEEGLSLLAARSPTEAASKLYTTI